MGRTGHWPGPSPSLRCCSCAGAAPGPPSRAPGQALWGHASTRGRTFGSGCAAGAAPAGPFTLSLGAQSFGGGRGREQSALTTGLPSTGTGTQTSHVGRCLASRVGTDRSQAHRPGTLALASVLMSVLGLRRSM